MMTGELNGLDLFINPFIKGELRFGTISLVFLFIFIVLGTILITNLMVIMNSQFKTSL